MRIPRVSKPSKSLLLENLPLANRMLSAGLRQLADVGVVLLLLIVCGSNTSSQCGPRGKRLGQFLSAARHAEGQLRVLGVGDGKPIGTRPSWDAESRLTEEGS